MGNSRICSRGFPEVLVHGAQRAVHYYHAHELVIGYTIAKDSPKVVLYENLQAKLNVGL